MPTCPHASDECDFCIDNYCVNKDCWFLNRVDRHDKKLIKVIKELKEKAFGNGCILKIQELKGNKYIINDYGDGIEHVIEPYDIEWITVK
jgi:hypothetical protein